MVLLLLSSNARVKHKLQQQETAAGSEDLLSGVPLTLLGRSFLGGAVKPAHDDGFEPAEVITPWSTQIMASLLHRYIQLCYNNNW